MNEATIAPVLLRLKSALEARDFSQCALLTKLLLLQDVCIKWDGAGSFTLGWAEWQAGQAGSFRSSYTCRLNYSAWTKPAPARKVGNFWSGGSSSSIALPGSGHNVSVTEEQFKLAMRKLGRLVGS